MPRAGRALTSRLLSPIARQIAALGLALGVVALALAYPVRGYVHQQQAEREAVAQQQELQDHVARLQEQLAAWKDPAYIRQEAKRRLQYVTPGDTVYVVKVPSSILDSDHDTTAHDTMAHGQPAHDQATQGDSDGDLDTAGADEPPWYGPLWATLVGS